MSLLRAALHTPLRSFSRASAASTGTQLAALAYRRYLSDEARSIIDKAVKAQPVVLFMKGTPDKPQCGFSRAVIQILDLHSVPPSKLQTYNVLADPELRSGIKEYSNWPTIPQLYVKGEFIGGCDIIMSMHQNGELESLFTKEDIVEPAAPEAASPKPSSA
ncbi:monothiol glutaredoxin grx5 [Tulasnella sp. 424]|nr:monothiol glutaredoxin grx5 [Tulasnella sp. 424]KAG8974948.1 monothiol glutaredoxin grx5 [Tulasnella sp. 425]